MNPRTKRQALDGPAGPIECAVDDPTDGAPRGVAVFCHPHPLHGGTLDNKVVQTLARCALQRGWRAVRFNFRGVGASAGQWDAGAGEIDDAARVVEAFCPPGQPWALGGFSFGGYVASHVAVRRAAQADAPRHLILVGPAVGNFRAADVPPHAVVIHGELDDVVALSAVLDWARPQTLPVTVLPGAGHFFHGQLGHLKQIVLDRWHDEPLTP